MKPRIGFVVSYAPLEVGWEKVPMLLAQAQSLLSALPVEIVAADTPVYDTKSGAAAADKFYHAQVDVVCWIAATWSFDHVPVDMLHTVNVPLIAWALPGVETGSLCGCQQLIAVLTELSHPRHFVFGELTDDSVQASMLSFARAAAALGRLRKTRLGMLGHRTIGMMEVAFHEYDLLKAFGPVVVYLGVDKLLRMRDAIEDKAASPIWNTFKGRAGKCNVNDSDGIRSIKTYLALKQFVDENNLSGIAAGCYPELMGEVCLACGLLAEDDIVTSCEGDMNSLVLTHLMHHIGGDALHNTDLLDLDASSGTGIFSHCGNSALCLAGARQDITLDSVRLMGQGAVSLYPAKPGQVTFANLCGNKGTYRLTYGVGEAVQTGMVFPGIPVKIKLPVAVSSFLEKTAQFGTGHHWMIAYGDMSKSLKHICEIKKISSLEFV